MFWAPERLLYPESALTNSVTFVYLGEPHPGVLRGRERVQVAHRQSCSPALGVGSSATPTRRRLRSGEQVQPPQRRVLPVGMPRWVSRGQSRGTETGFLVGFPLARAKGPPVPSGEAAWGATQSSPPSVTPELAGNQARPPTGFPVWGNRQAPTGGPNGLLSILGSLWLLEKPLH